MMIEMNEAAELFRALGYPTRLRIVRNLGCCPETINGPSASEVCCAATGSDKITSTVSHHLKELREATLIEMERQGKCMCCSLNRDTLKELAAYLNSIIEGETENDCC